MSNMNYKDFPKFTLNGYETDAYCAKVVDGDSVHLCMRILGGNEGFKFLCRLDGIDTPEKRDKDPTVKKRAKDAEEYLRSLIGDKMVRVKCGKFDRYGRPLVDIYLDDIHINNHMIEKGHAVEYHGGRKESKNELN